jgi:anti-anti-sigma factor
MSAASRVRPDASREPWWAATPEFAVKSRRLGSTHHIAPVGELDIATGPTLERELRRVEATDVDRIELDLAAVTFIDSAGIRVLTDADARTRADGGRLQITRGPRGVQRVLELVGADHTLPLIAPAAERRRRMAHSAPRFVAEWSY